MRLHIADAYVCNDWAIIRKMVRVTHESRPYAPGGNEMKPIRQNERERDAYDEIVADILANPSCADEAKQRLRARFTVVDSPRPAALDDDLDDLWDNVPV